MPLRLALHLETPVCPQAHWEKMLLSSPKLSAIYLKALAIHMRAGLDEILSEKLRTMPARVWVWERTMPQYFGNVKASNVTINNTVIGLGQDILTRGQRLLKKQAIQQAIGVQSSTKPGTAVE